jgi:hypothetical protein
MRSRISRGRRNNGDCVYGDRFLTVAKGKLFQWANLLLDMLMANDMRVDESGGYLLIEVSEQALQHVWVTSKVLKVM